jgi:hypothetical protein
MQHGVTTRQLANSSSSGSSSWHCLPALMHLSVPLLLVCLLRVVLLLQSQTCHISLAAAAAAVPQQLWVLMLQCSSYRLRTCYSYQSSQQRRQQQLQQLLRLLLLVLLVRKRAPKSLRLLHKAACSSTCSSSSRLVLVVLAVLLQ